MYLLSLAALKLVKLILLFLCVSIAHAQQYPFWTQYRSNLFMMNPAAAGTKKDVDFGLSYRDQWVGMAGAPKTLSASLDGRVAKGKVGLGGFVFQDKIGPYSYTSVAIAAAYKIKFPDVALSFGMNGSYNSQGINGASLTYQNTQDAAFTNVLSTGKARAFNAAGGIMLYNDRFHIAISANNLAGTSFNYDLNPQDNIKKGQFKTVPHFCASIGYNWSGNPNFIWENNVMLVLVAGTPLLFDYYLRLHIKNAFFFGAGIRIGSAVVAQLGYTFQNWGQISYSYDYTTNMLNSYNSGSHEIKLRFFFEKQKKRKGRGTGEFIHQRYQYML
ncbi:MAG: type IX secretion system membrane protein PorP/SprF, partial [Bacteroidia bacterium]